MSKAGITWRNYLTRLEAGAAAAAALTGSSCKQETPKPAAATEIVAEYEQPAKQFKPKPNAARDWAELAKRAGYAGLYEIQCQTSKKISAGLQPLQVIDPMEPFESGTPAFVTNSNVVMLAVQ